jgi:hypothetical protein
MPSSAIILLNKVRSNVILGQIVCEIKSCCYSDLLDYLADRWRQELQIRCDLQPSSTSTTIPGCSVFNEETQLSNDNWQFVINEELRNEMMSSSVEAMAIATYPIVTYPIATYPIVTYPIATYLIATYHYLLPAPSLENASS